MAFAATTAAAAQAPTPRDVLALLSVYLDAYEQQMSAVVAEEAYEQSYDHMLVPPRRATTTRTLTSDFVFLTFPRDLAWMGFRDTFEVDGKPVRDRDSRLQRILSSGNTDALAQAYRIADDNSRYNLGDVPRTINVPTFALGLIAQKNRWRFKVRNVGVESLDGRRLARVEFRETEKPSIVRTREGSNQPVKVTALVDAHSGAVYRTVVDIDAARNVSPIRTRITVTYGADAGLGMLVPQSMVESYMRAGDSDAYGFNIVAQATYKNYRRFQTSGRIVP